VGNLVNRIQSRQSSS